MKDKIIKNFSETELIDLFRKMKDAGFPENVTEEMADVFVEQFMDDINYLKTDYFGKTAEEKLAFYEKAAAVMKSIGDKRAADVAGNLAVIWRRRKDPEKTYYYHHISQQLYKEAGNIYDSLIECMNLASAYHQFNENSKAIELLRTGLAEAGNKKLDPISASIAGNLASILVNTGGDEQEILSCFQIEEDYFTKKNEYRDLAISLYNQIGWSPKKKDPDYESAVRKFVQLKILVAEHHMSDFYDAVQNIEAYLASLFA